MKTIKTILFVLICMTSTFNCSVRFETVKSDEHRKASVFDQRCSRCHDLKRVVALERDEETWRKTITDMCRKKDSHICEDEIDVMVHYHVQRQQKDQKLFESKCSRCHKRMNMQSPPEIEKTPDEWRRTIKRMMGKTNEVMTDENVDTLIHYHIRAHSTIILGKLEAESKKLSLGSTGLFGRKCSTCHSLDKALHTLRDRESWQKIIQNMARKKWSGIMESDIYRLVNFHVNRQSKEQELFLRDCNQCHSADIALQTVKTHDQWRETARKMIERTGKKVSEDQIDILTQYHIRYERTITDLAMKKCSRCHGRERILSRIGIGVAWEQLILDMSQKEGSGITSDDIKKLVQYHVAKQKIEQKIFEKDCSACHESEETLKIKKSKDEWRQTIRHMMAKSNKIITDEEIDTLIDFHIRRAP